MKNEMTFYVGTDINKYKMDPDYFQIQCCDIISELTSSLQKLMYNPTPPPPEKPLYIICGLIYVLSVTLVATVMLGQF